MSVRNEFTVEFTHSLHTFLPHAAHDAITVETEDWEDDGRLENRSRNIEDS